MGKTAHDYVRDRKRRTTSYKQRAQMRGTQGDVTIADIIDELPEKPSISSLNVPHGKDWKKYMEMLRDGLFPIHSPEQRDVILSGGLVGSMGPSYESVFGIRLGAGLGSPQDVCWVPAWAMAVYRLNKGKPDTKERVQKKIPQLMHDSRGQLTVCGQALLATEPDVDFRVALKAWVSKLRKLKELRKQEGNKA